MGFEGFFKKKEVPQEALEANDNEAGVDTDEIARKLETYGDTNLTPPSMGRQMLSKLHESILQVEDQGARSVLEGKYDKAALKLWRSIIPNNQDSRSLAAAFDDDWQADQYDKNLTDIKAFPFFDIEAKMEAIKLAELKQEGWGDYIREDKRLDARENPS